MRRSCLIRPRSGRPSCPGTPGRPGPALAPARVTVARAGQRGDAPADAGGPRRAGLATPGCSAGRGRRPRRGAARRTCMRAWGKLGYPRRALRLRAARRRDRRADGGVVPDDVEAARPARDRHLHRAGGRGFAYGQRAPVVDTNVRRVVARPCTGGPRPGRRPAARPRRATALLRPTAAAAPLRGRG